MILKRTQFRALMLVGLSFGWGFGTTPLLASEQGAAESIEDEDDDDDMLQPHELHDNSVIANPANEAALFVGGGLSFGQTRPTEAGGSPGASYLLHLEPGYQVPMGSWNRVELSVDLFTGRQEMRLNNKALSAPLEIPIDFGMIVKIGYGYSLGSGITGLARVGVGPVLAHVKSELGGVAAETSGSTGVAAQFGWIMLLNVTNAVDGTVGFSYTHTELDVGRFKGNDVAYNFGRSLVANTPSLDLGVRYRF